MEYANIKPFVYSLVDSLANRTEATAQDTMTSFLDDEIGDTVRNVNEEIEKGFTRSHLRTWNGPKHVPFMMDRARDIMDAMAEVVNEANTFQCPHCQMKQNLVNHDDLARTEQRRWPITDVYMAILTASEVDLWKQEY